MQTARVLVIGLDAAEASLLHRWCAAGHLPALRQLLERSASAVIDTSSRQFPDAATYSAYTGLRPARLGRYFFIQPSAAAPRLELLGASLPNGEPFWVTASRHGRRCIVVDTPKVGLCPPAGGVHVVGWGTHGFSADFATHPPNLAPDILARHGQYPLPNCDNHGRTQRSYDRLRRGLLAGVARRRDLLLDLMQTREWDLFFAVFSETHCAGHNLWGADADNLSGTDPEPSAAVREVYTSIDAAIGALIEAAGPDTRVVLLSTQGMRPQYHGRDLVPALLRLWGMHEQRNREPDPASETTAVARQPWLKVLRESVPLPWQYVVKDRLPRSLRDALLCRFMGVMALDVDARAYQVPNNEMTPALRLNVIGRDPAGKVRQGREYEELRDFLAARLRELINPATGKVALEDVSVTDELHSGEYRDVLPDLTGYWSAEAPIDALYSPGYGTLKGSHRDYRSGGHGPDGFLAVSGNANPLIGAHIADVAPTVLDLLGVPIPPGLDGRSLIASA